MQFTGEDTGPDPKEGATAKVRLIDIDKDTPESGAMKLEVSANVFNAALDVLPKSGMGKGLLCSESDYQTTHKELVLHELEIDH